jgi:dTDP-4-dehydrorhamnose 3,5-epimerase
MKFFPTGLSGAYVIKLEKIKDGRGFFARSWCEREATELGLNPRIAQCNVSHNDKAGTLRGMHYQSAPFEEAKLVRCTAGAIYDVIIDLRPSSSSFKQHFGAVLDSGNHKMMYVPEGFAHGFLTLVEGSEVSYQMSEFYSPAHARGVRWNDPAFSIEWPEAVRVISDRDNAFPDFDA